MTRNGISGMVLDFLLSLVRWHVERPRRRKTLLKSLTWVDEEGHLSTVQQLWHKSNPCKSMALIWLVLNEVLPIGLGVLTWEKAPFVNLCKEHIEISKHCLVDC